MLALLLGALLLPAALAAGAVPGLLPLLGDLLVPPEGVMMVDETLDAYADAIAPLDDGGFVIAGAAVPLAKVGPPPEAVPIDALVARYDAQGVRMWSAAPDFGGQDVFRDVVVGPGGEVVAVGETYDGAYAHTARAQGWDLDGTPRWSLAYDHPGASMTTFTAAALDGDAVVALGYVSIATGDNVVLHPIMARIGLDGAVLRVIGFPGLPNVVWLDLARAGPDTFEVAGSVGGPLGLGACTARVRGAEVLRDRCGTETGDGLFGIAAGPWGTAAAGLAKAGASTVAATAAWDSAGSRQWTQRHDLSDPSAERRATDIAADVAGNTYAAVIIGAPPTSWTSSTNRLVAALTGGSPTLSLNALAYGPDGTLAWTFEHREPGFHVYPLGAAAAPGHLFVAGARADAATLGIHPMVLRLAV